MVQRMLLRGNQVAFRIPPFGKRLQTPHVHLRGPRYALMEPLELVEEKTTSQYLASLLNSFAYEPIYRVILHYNQWQDAKPIALRVRQAVPVLSGADAQRVVENAQAHGTAIVITAPHDDAEMYESRLTRVGLKASIEVA